MLSMAQACTASVFTVGLSGLTIDGHNIAIVPSSSQVVNPPEVTEVQLVEQVLAQQELGVLEQVAYLEELLQVGDPQVPRLEVYPAES